MRDIHIEYEGLDDNTNTDILYSAYYVKQDCHSCSLVDQTFFGTDCYHFISLAISAHTKKWSGILLISKLFLTSHEICEVLIRSCVFLGYLRVAKHISLKWMIKKLLQQRDYGNVTYVCTY